MKEKKKQKNSYAWKHTINNSFMVIVQNVFFCVFFDSPYFFSLKGHSSKQNVLQLTKEEENLSKSQYRYRRIIK